MDCHMYCITGNDYIWKLSGVWYKCHTITSDRSKTCKKTWDRAGHQYHSRLSSYIVLTMIWYFFEFRPVFQANTVYCTVMLCMNVKNHVNLYDMIFCSFWHPPKYHRNYQFNALPLGSITSTVLRYHWKRKDLFILNRSEIALIKFRLNHHPCIIWQYDRSQIFSRLVLFCYGEDIWSWKNLGKKFSAVEEVPTLPWG